MAQTRTDMMGNGLFQTETPQSKKKNAQQLCEEKGGLWDARTGTCFLPQIAPDVTPPAAKEAINNLRGIKKEEAPKPVKPATPEVFRDQATGELSGVTLPSGESFLGLKPEEVKNMIATHQERTSLPAGTQPAGTAQAGVERAARIQQLVEMGRQGLLTPQELQAIQEAPIDWGQALTAGSLGNLPSVLTNVGVGAAAGAGVGAAVFGVGAIPGAIVGGTAGLIKSIWGGTTANIKKQQAGQIAVTKDVLAAARTNMKALALVASKDPSKAEEAITLYFQQLAQVNRAHRQLQLETQGNLNKFMEDGTEDLSDFELFLQPGGYADIQLARLQQALLKGAPASDAELLQFFEEEFNNE